MLRKYLKYGVIDPREITEEELDAFFNEWD